MAELVRRITCCFELDSQVVRSSDLGCIELEVVQLVKDRTRRRSRTSRTRQLVAL